MSIKAILILFIVLKAAIFVFERFIAFLNRTYYENPERQAEAKALLSISNDEMEKTISYSRDKYSFQMVSQFVSTSVVLAFLAIGGLGVIEGWAGSLSSLIGAGDIVKGVFFFLLIALASMVLGLPFAYYNTFVIEAKHGFNRQSVRGFVVDRVKGLLIGFLLGGGILSLVLWIMESTGDIWWVFAWLAMTGFSVVTAWLYPALLAPLFNKFTPVEDGDLKAKIDELANKIGFKTDGLFVMNASIRSSHGNAYFTGLFGKKRIVLFDTLVDSMSVDEVVAVLAHELGHFKLNHIRWQLIRSTLFTGLTFYLLSLCLPLSSFYEAFGLSGISNYGGLMVFGLWFGIVDFALQPLENFISRSNEFAADSFAKKQMGTGELLKDALKKLRQKSQAMPMSHPLFSSVYYSHPPLFERLKAL